jgi:hypothetical protein
VSDIAGRRGFRRTSPTPSRPGRPGQAAGTKKTRETLSVIFIGAFPIKLRFQPQTCTNQLTLTHPHRANHDQPIRKCTKLTPPPAAKTIKEDSVPSLVVPGVFLGSVGAAHDKSSLDANGITHILTVAGGFPPKFPESYDYLVVDVADASCENLTSHFDACLKFMCVLRLSQILTPTFTDPFVTVYVHYL